MTSDTEERVDSTPTTDDGDHEKQAHIGLWLAVRADERAWRAGE